MDAFKEALKRKMDHMHAKHGQGEHGLAVEVEVGPHSKHELGDDVEAEHELSSGQHLKEGEHEDEQEGHDGDMAPDLEHDHDGGDSADHMAVAENLDHESPEAAAHAHKMKILHGLADHGHMGRSSMGLGERAASKAKEHLAMMSKGKKY